MTIVAVPSPPDTCLGGRYPTMTRFESTTNVLQVDGSPRRGAAASGNEPPTSTTPKAFATFTICVGAPPSQGFGIQAQRPPGDPPVLILCPASSLCSSNQSISSEPRMSSCPAPKPKFRPTKPAREALFSKPPHSSQAEKLGKCCGISISIRSRGHTDTQTD